MVRGLDDGIAVRFVSSSVLFLGYLGCLLSRSVLGCWKVGDVWIVFSLWMWMPFNTAVLAFKAFALAAALRGDRGFLLHLQYCLCEKPQNIFKSQNNQNLGKKKIRLESVLLLIPFASGSNMPQHYTTLNCTVLTYHPTARGGKP